MVGCRRARVGRNARPGSRGDRACGGRFGGDRVLPEQRGRRRRLGRVESGEGHRSELELYELSERAGWLRRVLPVFGVLVVVLVVRRFLRRR